MPLTMFQRSQVSACLFIFAACGLPVVAQNPQTSAAPSSQAAGPKQRVQTEIVSVTRNSALPSRIDRKAGPFFLLLVSPIRDSQLNVALVPAVAVPDPLKLKNTSDLRSLQIKRRSAGLVDLVPGEYYLQSFPSQKTICTIAIR